jgi:HEAT repeat protein
VLVEQFNSAGVFWKQFGVAEEIVELHDKSLLPQLERHLSDEDRHSRGNAAFVFAALADDRGFDVISTILNDRSARRGGQGANVTGVGIVSLEQQIAADRYYAAWLFGQLKDRRAAPVLIPLLEDPEVRLAASYSLGEIGDKSAVRPLMETLNDRDTSMRLTTIRALEKLDGREALPELRSVLEEAQMLIVIPGNDLVAKAAREAVAKLDKMPR